MPCSQRIQSCPVKRQRLERRGQSTGLKGGARRGCGRGKRGQQEEKAEEQEDTP